MDKILSFRKQAPELDFTLALEIEEACSSYKPLATAIANIEVFGWKFKATTQRRGWCSYSQQLITLPAWVLAYATEQKYEKQKGFFTYYLAHEVAHALTSPYKPAHGQEFMNKLKRICPPAFIHYELEYKPREAKAAGISYQNVEI